MSVLKATQWSEKNNNIKCFETSAKASINISEAIQELAKQALSYTMLLKARAQEYPHILFTSRKAKDDVKLKDKNPKKGADKEKRTCYS